MSEFIKRKSIFRIVASGLILSFVFYIIFCRGWVKSFRITEQNTNTLLEMIELLDYDVFQHFNNIHELELNNKDYTISYNENTQSYDVRLFSIGEDSLNFNICKKGKFQLNFDMNGMVSSEKHVKKIIKSRYGSIDLLYNFFSNEIQVEKGTAYFSPISRVRSEIYSFTGEKNISGLLMSDNFVVGFSCTSKNGDIDLMYDFVNYLLQLSKA